MTVPPDVVRVIERFLALGVNGRILLQVVDGRVVGGECVTSFKARRIEEARGVIATACGVYATR